LVDRKLELLAKEEHYGVSVARIKRVNGSGKTSGHWRVATPSLHCGRPLPGPDDMAVRNKGD